MVGRDVGMDGQSAPMVGILPMFFFYCQLSAGVSFNDTQMLYRLARQQPYSVAIDAVRALTYVSPVRQDVWRSATWSLGIFIVRIVLSRRPFRNATS